MYYMRYIEGVPRSKQILWFIDNYVTEGYKTADRQHVLDNRTRIDNDDRDEIGVKVSNYFYEYLLPLFENVDRYTEVFYPVNNITLGELI